MCRSVLRGYPCYPVFHLSDSFAAYLYLSCHLTRDTTSSSSISIFPKLFVSYSFEAFNIFDLRDWKERVVAIPFFIVCEDSHWLVGCTKGGYQRSSVFWRLGQLRFALYDTAPRPAFDCITRSCATSTPIYSGFSRTANIHDRHIYLC